MMRLPRPSITNQRRLTRLMQLVLLGVVAYGLIELEPKLITNGSVALAITFVPALLERNYEIPLDPWLALWITTAVFLHSMGTVALYAQIGWWDHLTHAMSASVVAAVGYTTARAVDLHSDEIHLPHRFAFVYILVFVLAFGVIWELFEYGLDILAIVTGFEMPLAQHGLDDTVRDLLFDTIGALVVAFFGQVHLTDVAETLRTSFLTEN